LTTNDTIDKSQNNLRDFLPCQFSENDITKWFEYRKSYFSYLENLNDEKERMLFKELQL